MKALRALILVLVVVLALGTAVPAAAAPQVYIGPSHGCQWYYFPRWEVEDVAWVYMGGGTVYSIAGFGADGTVIGIPVGLALTAMGGTLIFGGSWLLWYVDTYYPYGVWEYLCR